MKKTGRPIVECYVVRIYRRDRKNAFLAEGVVEVPGGDALMVFHSAGELLDGLAFPRDNKASNEKRSKYKYREEV